MRELKSQQRLMLRSVKQASEVWSNHATRDDILVGEGENEWTVRSPHRLSSISVAWRRAPALSFCRKPRDLRHGSAAGQHG